MRFLAFFALLLMPAIALGQAAGIVDPAADPFGLLQQILALVKEHNWLAAAPAALVGIVFFVRPVLGKKWPFFLTDRGGAVITLMLEFAGLFASAALLPGPHTFVQVLVAAVAAVIGNQAFFQRLNKVFFPKGADKAELVAADANAAAAQPVKPSDTASAINGELKK